MSSIPRMLAIIALAALVQAVFAGALGVYGVKPSLVLVLVYMLAVSHGEGRGILFGAAGGLAEDMLSSGPAGLMLSGYALVGYLAGRLGHRVLNVGEAGNMAGIFALSLVHGLYTACVLSTLMGPYELGRALLFNALPQALYNALVGAAFVWFISRERSWTAERLRAAFEVRPGMEHELL